MEKRKCHSEMVSIMSTLYANLLIVVGIAVPVTASVTERVPPVMNQVTRSSNFWVRLKSTARSELCDCIIHIKYYGSSCVPSHRSSFQGFYLYLYLVSVAFVVAMYIIVLRDKAVRNLTQKKQQQTFPFNEKGEREFSQVRGSR